MTGRDMTKEQLTEIIDLIASGETVVDACIATKHSTASFYKWLQEYPELEKLYARVNEAEVEKEVDGMKPLEDELLHEIKENPTISSAIVNAYRVKFDNIKWRACHRKSKKYGDHVDVTSAGDKITEINVSFAQPKSQVDGN
jgi:hypothetical protein